MAKTSFVNNKIKIILMKVTNSDAVSEIGRIIVGPPLKIWVDFKFFPLSIVVVLSGLYNNVTRYYKRKKK